MTGIEELRELAGGIRCTIKLYGVTSFDYDAEHGLSRSDFGGYLRDLLGDIADQIEREHAEDCFRMGERLAADGARIEAEQALCVEVGAPMDEGADPLDVLRRHVVCLSDTVENLRLELGEQSDAAAWVRAHGGIGGIERTIASLNDRIYRRQRQIDESHEALRRRNALIAELEHERDELRDEAAWAESLSGILDGWADLLGFPEQKGDPGKITARVDAVLDGTWRRLMPEGMEWPRFEDGEPVRVGDVAPFGDDDVMEVTGVEINHFGYVLHGSINDGMRECVDGDEHGVAVKRPAKVLDADGAEIRVKETVFDKNTGEELIVTGFEDGCVWCEHRMTDADALPVRGMWSPDLLTHERPDSYDALWEDIENCAVGYTDFVRRAKKLAERGER